MLEEVRGQDEALAVPGVTGLEISIARGRPVRPLPEGDLRPEARVVARPDSTFLVTNMMRSVLNEGTGAGDGRRGGERASDVAIGSVV